MAKQPTDGTTKPSQFRLGDDVKANLDLIATHHSGETGVTLTRTDAVRIAAKREADRIRAMGPARPQEVQAPAPPGGAKKKRGPKPKGGAE